MGGSTRRRAQRGCSHLNERDLSTTREPCICKRLTSYMHAVYIHISHHTGFTRSNEDFECYEMEVQGGSTFKLMHMERSQERSKWIHKEKGPKSMFASRRTGSFYDKGT